MFRLSKSDFFIAQVYAQIQREHQISPGDFPNLQRMKEQLQHHDFTKFNPIKLKLLDTVDKMLAQDIAKLMIMIPQVSLVFLLTNFFTGLIF